MSRQTDKYYFFYRGPFSNWYHSDFIVDGINFNCGEQWMMYSKAILFGDHGTANMILEERHPAMQKKLGGDVKPFIKELWASQCVELTARGLIDKFRQNGKLLKLLLATRNLEIVEASPVDTIWGVGLAENDPLIDNKENWKGTNYLGVALMMARNALRGLCPVCGYRDLVDAPVDYLVCPCCGTEFDYDDFEKSHKQLRREWIEGGYEWFSIFNEKPDNWNPKVQLENLGVY